MTATMTSRLKISLEFLQSRRNDRSDERNSQSQIAIQPRHQSQTMIPDQQQQQQEQEEEQPETHHQAYTIPTREEDTPPCFRRASLVAAHDFIHTTIYSQDRFLAHASQIRIDCPYTLTELHRLGDLPQAEGVAACRRLVRVPVINDEIGLFLWTRLAETAARGASSISRREEEKAAEEDEVRRLRSEIFLAQLDQRFRFDRPSPAAPVAADRRRNSSPISPRQTRQRSFVATGSPSSSSSHQQPRTFSRQDSINEVPEEIWGESLEGMISTRGKPQPETSLAAERQQQQQSQTQARPTQFFSASRSSSYTGSPREGGTPTTSGSQASSVRRLGSGSIAGRLGSVVGGLGRSLGAVLGEGNSSGSNLRRASGSV